MSHGQSVVGLTKKGAKFFTLSSTLTETIQNIAVEDTRIWTGCENIYNLYNDGKDAGFYISKDVINHLIIAHVTRDTDFDVVLACQDSSIRIIHTSNLFLEIPTDSPVTALAFMEIESDPSNIKGPTAIVYGLSTGVLGLVQVFSNGEYTHIWSIEDGEARNPITCISVYDIDKDKSLEIIVGRDDGRIEVFKQQPETLFAVPYRVFNKDIGELCCDSFVHSVCTNCYGLNDVEYAVFLIRWTPSYTFSNVCDVQRTLAPSDVCLSIF